MKKNRGEIVTLLTIGTLVVMGISALVSSVFLKKQQTTKTNAQTPLCVCQQDRATYSWQGDGCGTCWGQQCTVGGTLPTSCLGQSSALATPVPTSSAQAPNAPCAANPSASGCLGHCTDCTGPNQTCILRTDKYPNCDDGGCTTQRKECPGDKTSTTPAPTPCPNGKIDKAGQCNSACCSVNSECPTGQTCGVQNGYCYSGFSCAPNAAGQTKPLYARVCGGENNNYCAWTFCNGTTTTDPVTGKTVTCTDDQNSGKGIGCNSDDDCKTPVTNNTCFYLTDEIYYDQGKGFSHNIKFWSPTGGGDGHISLSRNGNNTGLRDTPWKRQDNVPFPVPPEYTGGYNNNTSDTANFTGTADHCKQGIGTASITCGTGKNADGTVFVRGGGCQLMNAKNTLPTAAPTPKPTAPTPTPALTQSQFQTECVNHPERASNYFTLNGSCYSCDMYEKSLNKVDMSWCNKGQTAKPACPADWESKGYGCVDPTTCGANGSTAHTEYSCGTTRKDQVCCAPPGTKVVPPSSGTCTNCHGQQPVAPPTTTNKCQDFTSGKTISCPGYDQIPDPNNPANTFKRTIGCPANGAQECVFNCFDLNRNTKVSCYPGQYGGIDFLGPKNQFALSVLNTRDDQAVIIITVRVQESGFGISTGTTIYTPNTKINPHSSADIVLPGQECGLVTLNGDRTVSLVYNYEKDPHKDYYMTNLNFGCSSRPVVTIK